MAAESLQHKLSRVRRPRVHITYDVETHGGMQKVELPLVVGVFADLSAQSAGAQRPLKQRQFVPIDRDNFNDVLEKAAPRLALRVPNRLTDENTQLPIELQFRHLDDFAPDRAAGQVGPLRELLAVRHRLTQLLSRMEGNDGLEQLLSQVMTNTEMARALEQAVQAADRPAGD
jgi:type VI secretion system protein ImpB